MFCTRAGIIIYECKFYVFTRNQGRVKDMRKNEKFYGKELTTIENFKTATTTTTTTTGGKNNTHTGMLNVLSFEMKTN
ncbi:hypothetical protein Phum_PHUM018770 [Pediculus humanus corporis]|uniref:Uncharacterized protein n=1 Tax=Pediculus humanus subsp. corporis TaxID=121224 RepID=E0V9P0_PEDHC|nr:uncharacterized protein Phum_PHUM018770 [Pediculus humanus corporis]EEB10109.1 hypothetical protein Phum_PHUM018770 [Pediculus humanus corporis]